MKMDDMSLKFFCPYQNAFYHTHMHFESKIHQYWTTNSVFLSIMAYLDGRNIHIATKSIRDHIDHNYLTFDT